jgi:hypothetical protein
MGLGLGFGRSWSWVPKILGGPPKAVCPFSGVKNGMRQRSHQLREHYELAIMGRRGVAAIRAVSRATGRTGIPGAACCAPFHSPTLYFHCTSKTYITTVPHNKVLPHTVLQHTVPLPHPYFRIIRNSTPYCSLYPYSRAVRDGHVVAGGQAADAHPSSRLPKTQDLGGGRLARVFPMLRKSMEMPKILGGSPPRSWSRSWAWSLGAPPRPKI